MSTSWWIIVLSVGAVFILIAIGREILLIRQTIRDIQEAMDDVYEKPP